MSLPYTYKMTLSYDGTDFGGWQVQPGVITIQQLLQEALAVVLRVPTYATGAGRTDAGVHAYQQCAHFQTATPVDLRRLLVSLNGLLPAAIRIKVLEPVTSDFHARYSASGKIYRYHLTLGRCANPFTRFYSWHIPFSYDQEKAYAASRYLVGTHDFRSFANKRGKEDHDTVRTIHRIDSIATPDGLYYEFEGSGFLYKMVRNLVGFLVEVAIGKRLPDSVPQLLQARDRRACGSAAPPHGLFLCQVLYPNQFILE